VATGDKWWAKPKPKPKPKAKPKATDPPLVVEVKRKRGRPALPPEQRQGEHASDAARKARGRRAARDIEIPECVDPARRAAAEDHPYAFGQTYFTSPPSSKYPYEKPLLSAPCADFHHEMMDAFKQRILYGGLKAYAIMRGGGKDTSACISVLWGTLCGLLPCSVYATYEDRERLKRLELIKWQLENNDLLFEDYPEVCAPVRALERSASRGRQQTYKGEFTYIVWGQEAVQLPMIPGSVSSGAVIGTATLNGSIRGQNVLGRRPAFVVISDPSTAESAKSPTQIEDMMSKINGDIGGLGSHLDPLACVALVTIIRRGDAADQLTDTKLNPMWSGRRIPALTTWPERMDLWEEYGDLYKDGAMGDDPSGRKAQAFYEAHRDDMDRGASCAWPDGYIHRLSEDGITPLELSALQHLMNWKFQHGDAAFQTELQHEPPKDDEWNELTAEAVASRINGMPKGVLPSECDKKLVQFIDVHAREVHYVVMSFSMDGTCAVVDYDILRVEAPEGNLRDMDGPVADARERRIKEALESRRDEVRMGSVVYIDQEEHQRTIDMSMVDRGWLPGVVMGFIRESGPQWRGSIGCAATPKEMHWTRQIRMPDSKTLIGDEWYAKADQYGPCWFIHSDYWKMFVHERLCQSPGTPGSMSLFGVDPKQHRMFSSHIVAEKWDPEKKMWVQTKRHNHFFDCCAGCCAVANMLGVRLIAAKPAAHAMAQIGHEERNRSQARKSAGWRIGR